MTDEEHAREERLASELIQRYKKPIYRLAHQLAAGAGIEDDIFQNAFVRAFRWIRNNPTANVDNLEGFLRHCTRLAALDMHRQRSRIPETSQDMEAVAAVAGESRLISHLDLERFLGKLPEKERSVVTLTLEGFTEREIAEILGITPTYVGVLKHRGKAILRNFLTAAEQPGRQDQKK